MAFASSQRDRRRQAAAALLLTGTVLLGLLGVALRTPSPRASRPALAAPHPVQPPQWRRTTRGWERIDVPGAWQQLARDGQPPALTALHPLVVALLQLLLSTAALVARGGRPRPPRPTER